SGRDGLLRQRDNHRWSAALRRRIGDNQVYSERSRRTKRFFTDCWETQQRRPGCGQLQPFALAANRTFKWPSRA
ncbi:hypothetical protein, partial [Paraburkholderia oxyphila]|uniref:hypothetical protein n=1 Tax=Paraburkholderia oxyphila TaxID=614212 RepID=UPI001C3F2913